jgi:predicted ATPase
LKNRPFVIIGAYRDNEVGYRHPLTVALELMKLNSVPIYTVEVLPLTAQELKELLFEIIAGNDDLVRNATGLADVLLKKSQGNLFLYLEVMFLSLLSHSVAFTIRLPQKPCAL